MTNTQIRRARPDDLVEMQEVARRTIDGCYRSFLGDEGVDWFITSGESDKELENNLSNCDVLLRNGAIVAFTIYFDDLIHLMMVDVSLQRIGVGAQLLTHTEQKLFSAGHSVIRLETFEGNMQAIGFYLKNGWVEVDRQKDTEHNIVRVYFEKRSV